MIWVIIVILLIIIAGGVNPSAIEDVVKTLSVTAFTIFALALMYVVGCAAFQSPAPPVASEMVETQKAEATEEDWAQFHRAKQALMDCAKKLSKQPYAIQYKVCVPKYEALLPTTLDDGSFVKDSADLILKEGRK